MVLRLQVRFVLKRKEEIAALDASDEKSCADLPADIGGKVDILVNTTQHVRPDGLLDRQGTSIARDEIVQAYLGFINLAQAFRARDADAGRRWHQQLRRVAQRSVRLCAGELEDI